MSAATRTRRAPRLPAPAGELRGAGRSAEKLLQATHALLFERAGAEPPVSEICARAGVPAGMVAYCFGGKTRLLDAVVQRTNATIVGELERLAAADLPPEEKLSRHLAGVIANFQRYPYTRGLAEQLRIGDPQLAGMTEGFAKPALAFYERLVAEGVAAGVFRPVDPVFLLFTITGMCEFLFSARSWLEEAAERRLDQQLIADYTDHVAAILRHGVQEA